MLEDLEGQLRVAVDLHGEFFDGERLAGRRLEGGHELAFEGDDATRGFLAGLDAGLVVGVDADE